MSSAILQLTNQCNLDCSFCSSAFCPMCIKLENNSNSLKEEEWYKLIDELSFFGVTNLVLTGGEPAVFPHLVDIVNYGLNQQLNVTISTNGLIKIDGLPLETNVYINLFRIW
ncbi:radical SAM protein [Paenibacillus ihuae]|uniref:radical SAM protein n=1 Tax=Paenibacillus ihuae TaxID=1232431 RepID=UPI0009E85008